MCFWAWCIFVVNRMPVARIYILLWRSTRSLRQHVHPVFIVVKLDSEPLTHFHLHALRFVVRGSLSRISCLYVCLLSLFFHFSFHMSLPFSCLSRHLAFCQVIVISWGFIQPRTRRNLRQRPPKNPESFGLLWRFEVFSIFLRRQKVVVIIDFVVILVSIAFVIIKIF